MNDMTLKLALLDYQSGFGNEFASEALPDALPAVSGRTTARSQRRVWQGREKLHADIVVYAGLTGCV